MALNTKPTETRNGSLSGNIPVLPSLHNIRVEPPKPVEANNSAGSESVVASSIKNIDLKEVKQAIQAYAMDMKANNRMFEFALFNEREVNIENGKLTLTLENELQKTQLADYKGVFIDFLRNTFDFNFMIDAEVVAHTTETKKLLYTPTDKYKFMAEKYPVLEDLKRRLGLELEF